LCEKIVDLGEKRGGKGERDKSHPSHLSQGKKETEKRLSSPLTLTSHPQTRKREKRNSQTSHRKKKTIMYFRSDPRRRKNVYASINWGGRKSQNSYNRILDLRKEGGAEKRGLFPNYRKKKGTNVCDAVVYFLGKR